jgi:diaminopimelate epimerase
MLPIIRSIRNIYICRTDFKLIKQNSHMIKLTKMHGLGNDFVLLMNTDLPHEDYSSIAQKMCDRHLGIGADGILVILPSEIADIRMRIINSDGSEANMCGNGIRCFAKYVYERGLVKKEKFTVETFAGIITPELIIERGKVIAVKVNMGKPGLLSSDVPANSGTKNILDYPLAIDGKTYKISSLLMGVPHTMLYVDDAESANKRDLGPKIENHPLFGNRTNVNFVEVLSRTEIKVRTWERGAGDTLACGTGCCASVVASILNKKTENTVTVHLAVGNMQVVWDGGDVFMTGPATEVFSGVYELGL